jgi:hypothetical protein
VLSPSQGLKIDGEKPEFCYPIKFVRSFDVQQPMRLRLTSVFRLNHKQSSKCLASRLQEKYFRQLMKVN